jgi:hypothetical protein
LVERELLPRLKDQSVDSGGRQDYIVKPVLRPRNVCDGLAYQIPEQEVLQIFACHLRECLFYPKRDDLPRHRRIEQRFCIRDIESNADSAIGNRFGVRVIASICVGHENAVQYRDQLRLVRDRVGQVICYTDRAARVERPQQAVKRKVEHLKLARVDLPCALYDNYLIIADKWRQSPKLVVKILSKDIYPRTQKLHIEPVTDLQALARSVQNMQSVHSLHEADRIHNKPLTAPP